MSTPQHWFVVVNPASAGGRARRRWQRLARSLQDAGVRFEAALTDHPGHAGSLAQQALQQGYRRLLAAGGDGVVHEVLNGVMGQQQVLPSEVTLGAAPLGSGNDWARSRQLARGPDDIARCVVTGLSTPHDVGRLEFEAADSDSRVCYFINVAGAGLDARVLQSLPRHGPRAAAYFLGLLRSLPAYRPSLFTVVDGDEIRRQRLLAALLALTPYCGGGMRLAPMAVPDDGYFDLLTVDPLRMPFDLLRLRRLFDGRLAEERFAHFSRSSRLHIAAEPPAAVQADGQLVGHTPLIATVLPSAIKALHGQAPRPVPLSDSGR